MCIYITLQAMSPDPIVPPNYGMSKPWYASTSYSTCCSSTPKPWYKQPMVFYYVLQYLLHPAMCIYITLPAMSSDPTVRVATVPPNYGMSKPWYVSTSYNTCCYSTPELWYEQAMVCLNITQYLLL